MKTMKLDKNKAMQAELRKNGIEASCKFLHKGSLKGRWSLYNPNIKWFGNKELQKKFTDLGFLDFDGKPLSDFSGNGGGFSVCVINTKIDTN